MSDEVPVHPVQTHTCRPGGRLPQPVTLAAYEVYSHVYGPQPALIQGECRGGFSVLEVIALLYAKSFPKKEWDMRVEEALRGSKNI